MATETVAAISPVIHVPADLQVTPNDESPKHGLSVRCFSSTVISAPLDAVWGSLRCFTFPAKLLPDIIETCAMEGDVAATTVGGVRKMRWRTGEEQTHTLLALDDLQHKATWEVSSSLAPTEASAIISHIHCLPVSDTKNTYIEWCTEFSSDVDGSVLSYHHKANQNTLKDICDYFQKDTEV